jgi:transcriptional regulator with XRE-family HTH domain
VDIGQRILKLRTAAGLSQETLAELLGVSRQSVSKWELGQALPDAARIVHLSQLFGVKTDALLMDKHPAVQMRFGMYIIVRDFAAVVAFYEKLLAVRLQIIGAERFAQMHIGGVCVGIMCQRHLGAHEIGGDHRCAFNFSVPCLRSEHTRLKALNIGRISAIFQAYPGYSFFNIYDPEGNTIEITGAYAVKKGETIMENAPLCQSCAMPMDAPDKFGREADGSTCADYCCHCWQGGKFTGESTLEQAVENNIPWWKEEGESDDIARQRIMAVFPNLKRWKTA